MVLRFEVNQAEAFRQGVDVDKSTNHLDVDPSKLSQEDRNLIADRLEGIDVVWLQASGSETLKPPRGYSPSDRRIVARLPTFEALMEAIRKNEKEVQAEISKR